MSIEVSMHRVQSIGISPVREHDNFCSREITIVDSKGDVLTITLFADSPDENENTKLDIKF